MSTLIRSYAVTFAGVAARADQIEANAYGTSLGKYGTVADMTAALTAAAAALVTGGTITIPKGVWAMAAGWNYTGQRVHLLGAGKNLSMVNFNPAAPGVAMSFNAGGGSGYVEGSVKQIGFTSSNSVDKTAISLVNVGNVEVHNVAIADGSWLGANSIGVLTAGRQLVHISNSKFACSRPVVVAQNASFTSLSADHFIFEKSELIGNSASFPVIEFSDGASFSSTTMQFLAIVKGKDGVRWVDTTSTAASFLLAFRDIRTEQGLDATAWSFDLESTAQNIQEVLFENIRLDLNRNGIKLRGAQRITARNVTFAGGAGKVSWDVTFVPGTVLSLTNCFSQAGSTRVFTNAKCVRSARSAVGIGFDELWVFDSGNFSDGEMRSDVYQSGIPVTVANNGTVNIADTTFTGWVNITTSEDVGARFFLSGTTGTVTKLEDQFNFFTNLKASAGKTNVSKVGSFYELENLRGASVVYTVHRIGSSA